METSDSEPEAKRQKMASLEAGLTDLSPPNSFGGNFSIEDYAFSSDDSDILGRLAVDNTGGGEKSNDSLSSCNADEAPQNVTVNETCDGDENDKNNSKGDAKFSSNSDLSSPALSRKRKSSFSDGSMPSVDFESDKESSSDLVISPFSSTADSRDFPAAANNNIHDFFSDSDSGSHHRMYDVEFEVASVSENNDNPIEDANSSSAVDEPVKLDMPRYDPSNDKNDRDTDNFADGEIQLSDPESDERLHKTSRIHTSDSELSDKDKWFCSQCGARSQPHFRYCLRCFRIRRNWLPKRTKPRKAKRKKIQKRVPITIVNDCDSEPIPSTSKDSSAMARSWTTHDTPKPPASDDSSSEMMMKSFLKNLIPGQPEDVDLDAVDGALRKPSVQGLKSLDILTPPPSDPHSLDLDSQSGSSSNKKSSVSTSNALLLDPPESPLSPPSSHQSLLQPQRSQSTSGQSAVKTSVNAKFIQSLKSALEDPVNIEVSTPKEENQSNVPMCNLCCVREKDAAFVHNKIAHHFCCFVCADKILKKNGKCPICRDRVFRVVKIISV